MFSFSTVPDKILIVLIPVVFYSLTRVIYFMIQVIFFTKALYPKRRLKKKKKKTTVIHNGATRLAEKGSEPFYIGPMKRPLKMKPTQARSSKCPMRTLEVEIIPLIEPDLGVFSFILFKTGNLV